MRTHDEKKPSTGSSLISGAAHQNKNTGQPKTRFADRRSTSTELTRLQEVANRSPRARQITQLQSRIEKSKLPAQLAGLKRTHSEAFGEDDNPEIGPPRKKRRLSGVERLKRTYRRNRDKKAKPSNPRAIYSHQQRHNYGFDDTSIEYGSVKGYFYKGPFGGQPYLGIKPVDYGLESKPTTNYDDIVKALGKFKDDAKLAEIILDNISNGTAFPENMASDIKANASLLIELTQFIEPHQSRIPGMDKFARSILRRVARGESTFREAFNRKNGLFVVARAKAGKSQYGGQEAGRTLIGLPAKKSDKSKHNDIWTPEIDQIAAEISDSSDDEE